MFRNICLSLCMVVGAAALPAQASGPAGEHVNHLTHNLDSYTAEVNWLIAKVDEMVDTYADEGADAVNSQNLVDDWESVDFHAAIETQYIPIYASIWQGLFGVKQGIDDKAAVAGVRTQQALLEQALWQALGAVKLAASYQDKGLLARVQTSADAPMTTEATFDEIRHRLDRVVAKYAEQVPKEALGIVHDTYLNLFEGVEGALIEQNAALVEDLEKDFNVTLPVAIQEGKTLDSVREIVTAMKSKLDKSKALLIDAEKARKDVF
ncbi:MAG: hypothetical protein ACK5ME_03345 [Parahaliea sp.]